MSDSDFDIATRRLQADQKSASAKLARQARARKLASAKAKREFKLARYQAQMRLREKEKKKIVRGACFWSFVIVRSTLQYPALPTTGAYGYGSSSGKQKCKPVSRFSSLTELTTAMIPSGTVVGLQCVRAYVRSFGGIQWQQEAAATIFSSATGHQRQAAETIFSINTTATELPELAFFWISPDRWRGLRL